MQIYIPQKAKGYLDGGFGGLGFRVEGVEFSY